MKSLTMRKNDLSKNSPKSYDKYKSELGPLSEEKYLESTASEHGAQNFKDTNYGKIAEKLASIGLSSSGYEDYIRTSTERNYDENLKTAKKNLLVGRYNEESGYSKYLSDYDNLQNKISKSLIEKIGKGSDFNIENAFNAAVDAGLSEEYAYFAAAKAVRNAKDNAVKNAVEFAKDNNLTAKRAKNYALSLGLDEAYAEDVYQAVLSYREAKKSTYSSMNADGYYNYLISTTN